MNARSKRFHIQRTQEAPPKEPVQAYVTSAVKLIKRERAAISRWLKAKHGADIKVEYIVDPDIIGGVILQVGDQVIDGSIAGKLETLRNHLRAAIR